MKKVLLIIFASLLSFTSANAVEFTVGLSGVNSVFAAEGTENNYNESGASPVVTKEYGAFSPSFGEVFLETGNETVSIGLAYAESFSTPTNVNEAGCCATGAGNTSSVNVAFEGYTTLYALVRAPWGLYGKLGWSTVDVKINETQKSGNTYNDTDTQGVVLGFGWQKSSDNGIGIRAEVTGHQFEDVSADNNVATSGNRNEISVSDMMGLSGRISILKTF